MGETRVCSLTPKFLLSIAFLFEVLIAKRMLVIIVKLSTYKKVEVKLTPDIVRRSEKRNIISMNNRFQRLLTIKLNVCYEEHPMSED
jgi:hypothetical protein